MEKWTQKETSWLKENYSKYTNPEIAEKLDRTVGSIRSKAKSLNLSKPSGFLSKCGKKGVKVTRTCKYCGREYKLPNWLEHLKKYHPRKFKEHQRKAGAKGGKIGGKVTAKKHPEVFEKLQRHIEKHPEVLSKGGKKAWEEHREKLSQNLRKGIEENKHTLPLSSYFPSEELAWLIGYILGDGHFKHTNDESWSIRVSTVDKELQECFMEKFKQWSNYDSFYTRKKNYDDRRDLFITRACFKEACKFLKPFEKDPLKCLKFFPKKYWKWILKGLWDAEGCITLSNANSLKLTFSNTDKEIQELYLRICKYLGFSPHQYGVNISILKTLEVVKFVRKIGVTVKRKITPEIERRISYAMENQGNFVEVKING